MLQNSCCGSDFGPAPFAVNLERATCENTNFRTALWTGNNLQVTLMCIPSGGEIGLEKHEDTDQLIYVVGGSGTVCMGAGKNNLNFRRTIGVGDAVFVPACTWHNISNSQRCPLRLYSVYAPPEHPRGTVFRTKADADAAGD